MFEVGDEIRFWTQEECALFHSGNTSDASYYNNNNTWGQIGVVIKKIRNNYIVRFGEIEKEIGPNAAKPIHPTEYELALEVLGEDYFQ